MGPRLPRQHYLLRWILLRGSVVGGHGGRTRENYSETCPVVNPTEGVDPVKAASSVMAVASVRTFLHNRWSFVPPLGRSSPPSGPGDLRPFRRVSRRGRCLPARSSSSARRVVSGVTPATRSRSTRVRESLPTRVQGGRPHAVVGRYPAHVHVADWHETAATTGRVDAVDSLGLEPAVGSPGTRP